MPDVGYTSDVSYQAFLALCDMSIIMDDVNRQLVLPGQSERRLSNGLSASSCRKNRALISDLIRRLEVWHSWTRAKGIFEYVPGSAAPGVCEWEGHSVDSGRD